MTQISRREALRRQEPTGVRLNKIENLAVRLDVAYSSQRQTDYPKMVEIGERIEIEVLAEVLKICNTDPAHRNVVNYHEAEHADWLDLKRTEEDARF